MGFVLVILYCASASTIDQCWPLSPEDAANIGGEGMRTRHVRLCTVARDITPARWSSFLWSASEAASEPHDHPAYLRHPVVQG